jgi:hypothetical protein
MAGKESNGKFKRYFWTSATHSHRVSASSFLIFFFLDEKETITPGRDKNERQLQSFSGRTAQEPPKKL